MGETGIEASSPDIHAGMLTATLPHTSITGRATFSTSTSQCQSTLMIVHDCGFRGKFTIKPLAPISEEKGI